MVTVLALLACTDSASEGSDAGEGAASPAGASGISAAGQASSAGDASAGVGAGAAGSSGTGGNAGAGTGAAAVAGMMANAGAGTSGASAGTDGATPSDAGADAGSSGSDGGTPSASCDPALTRDNRALVARAIDELFVDKDITAVDRHWSDPYHQHNPIARSGVATFRSLMSSIVSSPSFSYERLLTLADCDLVVVYGRYSQTGVIFDMFRVQDDKIMEHWDSDTSQASEVGELAAHDESAVTNDARALFTELSATVLIGGDTQSASELLAESYVEHHGSGGNGPAALIGFLQAEGVTYARVHHVIADGNYVFALSEGMRGSTAYGFYDLFRVQAGKLAEHWDSRRAVPGSTMSGLGIF